MGERSGEMFLEYRRLLLDAKDFDRILYKVMKFPCLQRLATQRLHKNAIASKVDPQCSLGERMLHIFPISPM